MYISFSIALYIQRLTCSRNHVEDHIMEETDMPDELIREVSGTKAFEQTLPQVSELHTRVSRVTIR